uniref:Uncharacterized protein n=1 Tax=Arundo donax TaxID=35708 RepID=A0A0A9FTX9_ARUDO
MRMLETRDSCRCCEFNNNRKRNRAG